MLPALELCLAAWIDRYQAHWFQKLTPPLGIRPFIQLKFPDVDGCFYLTHDFHLAQVGTSDGIDVLTSIRGHDFDDVYSRRECFPIDGIDVPVLSCADLEEISPEK